MFPEVGLKAPLVVPSLETDVHNTLHRVHAVLEQVRFAKLKLQGTNGHIQATVSFPLYCACVAMVAERRIQSLSADEGLIQTSNSEIYGSFNATKSLELVSDNGAILVSVKMVSGYNDPGPFKLDIRTTNGCVW